VKDVKGLLVLFAVMVLVLIGYLIVEVQW